MTLACGIVTDPYPRPTLFMLRGLPSAGKTTWANTMLGDGQTVRISADDLHALLRTATTQFVLQCRDWLILKCLEGGLSVIVDDANLQPGHEKTLRMLAGARADFKIVAFDTPVGICVRRDAERDNGVGRLRILDLHASWRRRWAHQCSGADITILNNLPKKEPKP